jgi:hypothetical protein
LTHVTTHGGVVKPGSAIGHLTRRLYYKS